MTNKIRKRRTYYLTGYDPRGPRHYHQLYRDQAGHQTKVNGQAMEVSPRRRAPGDMDEWTVRTTDGESHTTKTIYGFLRWDDLIRKHWAADWLAIVKDFFAGLRAYYVNGLIIRVAQADRKQIYAGTYPFLFIFLSLLAGGAALVFPAAGLALAGEANLITMLVATGAGIFLARFVMAKALALGNRLGVFWLLRLYVFSWRWARGEMSELDARIDEWAGLLADALADVENDEIVLVGHSVGSMLAVRLAARAIKVAAVRGIELAPKRFLLLTLGECIPLMSFHREAVIFREEMLSLSQNPHLVWLDYTAPNDGACFALVDPLAVSGLPAQHQADFRILSPRFFTLFTPERYAILRRDWYQMHFLYLMATELPGDYDFFKFTAGTAPAYSLAKDSPP